MIYGTPEDKRKARLLHNRRAVFPKESGFFLNLGQGALHLAAAEAAGTHVHPTGAAIDQNADALHIGGPDAMTLAIGMADIVAIQRTLFANLTKLTHENPLLKE